MRVPCFSTHSTILFASSPGRDLGGIDLLHHEPAGFDVFLERHSHRPYAHEKRMHRFVEREIDDLLAAQGSRVNEEARDGRLAAARRSHQQIARARVEPSADQRIELAIAGGERARLELRGILRRDESRKEFDPAAIDHVVMIAFHERGAPQLRYAQIAPVDAELQWRDEQREHAVDDALHLHVGTDRAAVVEEQNGGAKLREALLEREDLAPVTQRVLREQPHFRKRIEHEPCGLELRDALEQKRAQRVQLDLRRLEQRVLSLRRERPLDLGQLDDLDAVERPAVRLGYRVELRLRLRERHVEARLGAPNALQQELERERRLAHARVAVDQIETVAGQASVENLVEAGNAGRALL